jgi:hypothetical protein
MYISCRETILLVDLCNSLANGLIQPWTLKTEPPGLIYKKTTKDSAKAMADKGAAGAAAAKKPAAAAAPTIAISADATPDLKKAIEVWLGMCIINFFHYSQFQICEYAMKVTNGEVPSDVIPIGNRYPLLQTWVKAKQMLQSNIPKSFGTDDEACIYLIN